MRANHWCKQTVMQRQQPAYLHHFYNFSTTQVFVNEWAYPLTVTSSLQQPREILDWRLRDKHMANPNTANNIGCVQVRDVKLPDGYA